MNEPFTMDDPNVFDLAWLDDAELQTLRAAMLSNPKNQICAQWLKPLNEQAAIRSGKPQIIHGADEQDVDFTDYPTNDLRAAQPIFRAVAKQFKAIRKRTGQRFCEMMILHCIGGLEAKEKISVFT
jgi:hypothetical protein